MFDEVLSEKRLGKSLKVLVVGLGYVGYPLARSLSQQYTVWGYDKDTAVIERVERENAQIASFLCLPELTDQTTFDVAIIAVPTPVDDRCVPDLAQLYEATERVGRTMKKNAVVIFESTVSPGTTEEKCVPILKAASGLSYNRDFFVAYAPERVNPGDGEHTFDNTTKIVAASHPMAAAFVQQLYQKCICAKVYQASSIKTAEAVKMLENIQRDVNIALMNEFTAITRQLEIDSTELLALAGTKWNFHKYYPGLVGGHCIGVDPYYMISLAGELGCDSRIMQTAREVNEQMAGRIAKKICDYFAQEGVAMRDAAILIYGITFKADLGDIRNSKIIDLYTCLKGCGAQVYVVDDHADERQLWEQHSIRISKETPPVDAVVIGINHKEYYSFSASDLMPLFRESGRIKPIFDLYSVLDKKRFADGSASIWTL